jgi:hypothetical protein
MCVARHDGSQLVGLKCAAKAQLLEPCADGVAIVMRSGWWSIVFDRNKADFMAGDAGNFLDCAEVEAQIELLSIIATAMIDMSVCEQEVPAQDAVERAIVEGQVW